MPADDQARVAAHEDFKLPVGCDGRLADERDGRGEVVADASASPAATPVAATGLPSTSDRTLAVTVGRWGGVYARGYRGCWRLCVGFVAITYLRAEFTHVLKVWLDAESPA